MIYNNKYLFVHIQRSGGSFVEKFLLENFDGWDNLYPKHSGLFEIRGLFVDKIIQDRKVFGMIRNPWSWYVSWWSANSKLPKGKTMFPSIFTDKTVEDFNLFIRRTLTNELEPAPYFNFDCMVRDDIGPYTFRHLRCHYNPLTGKPIVNALIHRENIKDELSEFMKLDEPKKKIIYNMEPYHVGTHKLYWEYYNQESIDLVAYKDRIIIEDHGYKFGE